MITIWVIEVSSLLPSSPALPSSVVVLAGYVLQVLVARGSVLRLEGNASQNLGGSPKLGYHFGGSKNQAYRI